MKFALSLQSRNDHEGKTVAAHCSLNCIPWTVVRKPSECPSDAIPVGNVPWVSEVLGRNVTPDYYPDFLQSWIHRKIWQAQKWPHFHRVFVKPADCHKRFTGFVTNGTWKGRKRGPLWCSEVVQFVSEWRYYVANGRVIAAKWGSGVECEPPHLEIKWPMDYCAAVDFGSFENGKIALIEANSPFACGWYGPMGEGAVYAQWLSAGWEYMKRQP